MMRHDLPGWGRNLNLGRGDGGNYRGDASPPVLEPTPPRFQAICETCDNYVGPVHPICELIEAKLEAGAAGCCHGRVIAETRRVQREGGCPEGRF